MDVVRHQDVAEEEEAVAFSELLPDFFEDDAGLVVVEYGSRC